MNDLRHTLRLQLRAAIKASGLKQTWIAEQLGISQKHLSQLLTGRVALTIDWAEQIARLCNHRLTVTLTPTRNARTNLLAAHVALAEQAGRDQAALARVQRLIDQHPIAVPTNLLAAALDHAAHDDGPSVAECAKADDEHWNTKYAGEGS